MKAILITIFLSTAISAQATNVFSADISAYRSTGSEHLEPDLTSWINTFPSAELNGNIEKTVLIDGYSVKFGYYRSGHPVTELNVAHNIFDIYVEKDGEEVCYHSLYVVDVSELPYALWSCGDVSVRVKNSKFWPNN